MHEDFRTQLQREAENPAADCGEGHRFATLEDFFGFFFFRDALEELLTGQYPSLISIQNWARTLTLRIPATSSAASSACVRLDRHVNYMCTCCTHVAGAGLLALLLILKVSVLA